MVRNASTPDCSISGCTRAAARGKLCRSHNAMVPRSMVTEGMIEGMMAEHRVARKHQDRQFRYVRDLLKAGV